MGKILNQIILLLRCVGCRAAGQLALLHQSSHLCDNGAGGVIIIVGYGPHAKHILHVGEGWGIILVPSCGGCCI